MDVFHNLNRQFLDCCQALREQIESAVDEVNSLTRRVAELNNSVRSLRVENNPTSSLLDERDVAIDRLSELVEDVDFAELLTRSSANETTYRAALSAGSRLLRTTALDYL